MKKIFLGLALAAVSLGATAAPAMPQSLPELQPRTTAAASPHQGGDEDWCKTCVKKYIKKYGKGPKGDRGPVGPKGNRGPAGPKGERGPVGPVQVVQGERATVQPGGNVARQPAKCPTGTIVTGGGFLTQTNNDALTINRSTPNQEQNSWEASAYNGGSTDQWFQAFAVCIPTG
ncbi:hypothetical protein [Streptomyces sp. NPDC050504]|uniref:hypothetical protein n=1 Tax=Streptomyces sp. NPDC050504 TaxID=3365618 RepID=UPI00378D0582